MQYNYPLKVLLLVGAGSLLTSCDSTILSGSPARSSVDHTRPTLNSKKAGLQKTQSIFTERVTKDTAPSQSATIKATGLSSVAIQPSKNLNQRRLMAIRAAKLDAYRVLAEQIHGVKIDGQTTVAEAMLTSDVLSSAVRGTIMGAETLKIEPTGGDTYKVELSIRQSHLDRLIKLYKRGLL